MKATCSFPGCERKVTARGLCGGHWRQDMKGEPLRPLLTARAGPLPADHDERAYALARMSRGASPSVRAMTRGLGIKRPPHGPQVDGELLAAVHEGARCVDEEEFTELRYQSEADQWRAACIVCPVRELCYWLGRESWGWGMHGGVVLVAGIIAAEEPAGEDAASA